MTYLGQEKPSLEDLAHYGVPGMKWGHRKARTGLIDKKTARLDRVASGKGSVLDKAKTLSGASAHRLITSRGLKNEAARKSADLKEQKQRLATGHAKIADILKAYGTVSVVDLARSTRD